jgi:hypothetical protein
VVHFRTFAITKGSSSSTGAAADDSRRPPSSAYVWLFPSLQLVRRPDGET